MTGAGWGSEGWKLQHHGSYPKCQMLGYYLKVWASQVVLAVKNLPANTGDIKDVCSIPGSGRSPGRGHSKPLQYSWLEKPKDRGAWQATIHGLQRVRHD